MCGIIAGVGDKNYLIKSKLIDGLERLEYRGYDSSGISLLTDSNEFFTIKSSGKLAKLKNKIKKETSQTNSHIGIAHTRWATHGKASTNNAHPHEYQNYCIVHNGVIDNYQQIKAQIDENSLQSETDSEVMLAYLSGLVGDMPSKLKQLNENLSGSFSSVYLDKSDPKHLYAIKEKSPLIIGLAKSANFIASDASAFADLAEQLIYLEDGDIVQLSAKGYRIFNQELVEIEREKHINQMNISILSKGKFKHFMEKEIHQQPNAIEQTVAENLTKDSVIDGVFGVQSDHIFKSIENIHLVGCGTSFNACLLARYWVEELANIVARAETASEYLYRKVVIPNHSLIVLLSQSGETADIIGTVKKIRKVSPDTKILAICNTANSELVRIADLAFITAAGKEVSVASTKAFTTQLVSLMLLTLSIMKAKKVSASKISHLVKNLKQIPKKIKKVIEQSKAIEKKAYQLIDKKSVLFIARGMQFPIAIEGALKLKEISYIHAEAYAAGELKHGPLALIDRNMPVIAIIDENNLYEKIKSSLEIVSSRGGQLFILTNEKPTHELKKTSKGSIIFIKNNTSHYLSPILFSVALQLLAYYVALAKGTDIDQPRNLAKSVTVE